MATYEELKRRVANGGKTTTAKSRFEELKERVNNERFERDVQKVDPSYINMFLDYAGSFMDTAKDDYDNVGWGNALSTYRTRRDAWDDLDYRRSVIQRWAENNKANLDADDYTSLSGFLTDFQKQGSGVVDSFSSAKDYYGQFDTEDAYNQYKAYYDKWGHYADAEDYKDFSAKGAAIKNPTMSEVERGGAYYGKNITLKKTLPSRKEMEDELASLRKSYMPGAAFGGMTDENRQIKNRISYLQNELRRMDSDDYYSGVLDRLSKLDNETISYLDQLNAGKPKDTAVEMQGIADNRSWEERYAEDQAWENSIMQQLAKKGYTSEQVAQMRKDRTRQVNRETYDAEVEKSKAEAEENGFKASLKSVPQNLTGGLGVLSLAAQNAHRALTGDDAPVDYYTPEMIGQAKAQAARQTVSQRLEENTKLSTGLTGNVASFLYNTGMSMADSAAIALMAAAGIPPSVGTAFLGGTAATSAAVEAKNRGVSDGQALLTGLTAGIAEAVFERYSLGNLLETKPAQGVLRDRIFGTLKNIGVQGVVEGSEEVATTIANTLTDAIINGDASAYKQRVYEYMRNTPGMNYEEADRAAAKDWILSVAQDFLGGFLSGGVMSGAHTGIQVALQNEQAKQIYGEDPGALVGEALEIDPENAYAQKMQGRLDEGKRLTGGQMSRMARENETAMRAQDVSAIRAAAANRLTELGETENVPVISAALAKQAAGEKLTRAEEQVIANSKYGQRVANEMKPANIAEGGFASDWAQNLGTNRINAETYNAPLMKLANEMAGVKPADAPAAEAGQETVAPVDDSTPAPTAPVTARYMASDEVAVVAAAVKEMGVSPMVEQSLVDNFDGTDGRIYAADVKLAYQYGKMNFPKSSLEKLDIKPYQAERAYMLGRSDAKAEAIAPKVKRTVSGKRGTVIFETAVDENTLTPIQKASLNGIQAIADLSGLNVHVFESQQTEEGYKFILPDGTVTGANGWYVTGTNDIWVDLNAGNAGEGTMLYTASHEISHFIKEWSPDKWRGLADTLLEQYGEDVPLDALLERQMEKIRKRDASLKGNALMDAAYEELVSDALSEMLTDGTVVQKMAELKQKDRTLWEKIKDAIYALLEKWGVIRKEYEGRSVAPEAEFLRGMDEAFNKLQQLYAEAFVEASESYSAAAEVGVDIDAETESASPFLLSERTRTASEYVQEREKAAAEIAKAIGVSKKKALDYIDSINSIAKMIAEDRVRLDYFSSPGRSSFISNVEYGGSFDFSTLCKKRRLLTGTFTAIQKALPNTALTADEILDIRNRMKEKGLEVSCGLCYVEGSRANMGQFAKEFLKLYKEYFPDNWQPNMADVNTPDGIEWVRINHPECYEQYEYFWNHYGTLKTGDPNLFASQQKPKLYQLHTEYKGEVLEKFKNAENIEAKNRNGGIRLQSFSDFEIVHLIDVMQIVMDMSRVGLAGQAYTKVPDFAWALGDTGLKINLSLIAKGVDANGKLIFDDVEGMPIDTAMELRNRYSKNVGTILVAFNDQQLLAAMADERVDFIIPFHRSQWKKSQYEAMGLPAKTKDYTYMQNEKYIKPQYHEYRGKQVLDKATNYMPNEYWDFSKSGKENAEVYLKMCAENNKRPKFYKLLENNGDGSYSLKADGSTDGYWKLLIDFKMYDNDGVGSPQLPVRPDFNMEQAQRMLDTYQGGHSNFPVAHGIVDEFVKDYKASHKGAKLSDRDITQDPLFPPTEREAGVFKRSYMNKAGDLKAGETKGIIINTSASRYYVEAVGSSGLNPFTGEILKKVNADTGERISATQEEYDNGTYDAGEEDYLAYQTAQRKPGRGSNRHRSLKERLAAEGYAQLLDDESDGDSEGNRAVGGGAELKFSDRDYVAYDRTAILKESKVDEYLADYAAKSSPKYAQAYIAYVRPRTFLKLTTDDFIERMHIADQAGELDEQKLGSSRPGIYLRIDQETGTVIGHEGRHRMSAMEKAGIDKVPVLLLDTSNKMTKTDVAEITLRGQFNSVEIGTIKGAIPLNYENRDRVIQKFATQSAIQRIGELHGVNKTLRFSDRDTDSVSNRDLLAGAFEDIAQNDIERGKIQEYRTKVEQLNEQEQKLAEIRKELKELSFAKGPRDKEKISKLRDEAAKIANRIGIVDKQLLRLEASAPLMAVLEREKKLAYGRASQKWGDRMETARTGRNKTEMRHKIKRVVNELNQLLLNGSKDRHVMIGLQKATAEALSAINMDTVTADERLAKIQEKIDKATNPAEIAKLQQTYARVEKMGMNMATRLTALQNAYWEIKRSNDPLVANAYQPEIAERIENLHEMVGDTPLQNMTMEQLEYVYDTYKMVLTTIRDANKAFKNTKGKTIAVLGNQVMEEIQSVGGKHPLAVKALKGPLSFAWSGMKPVYAFKAIGSDTLSEMFDNIRAGEDTWAVDVSEAKEFYRQKTRQYHFDNLDFEKQYSFTSKTGKKFDLTLEQIMSLYAYSKRKQADAHLDKGGFVFDDAIEVVKKKHGIPVKYTVKTADAHKLSPETLMAICKTLTDEQVKFVDEMQEYLSSTMGGKGNEVSLELYGVKLFKEKYYFPLKSAKQYMHEQNEVAAEVKIKNSGFSKQTVEHASNPVILSNFTEVWANHVNDMAMYHAFVLPLEDFNRVFNYKTPNAADADTESVKMYLQNAYDSQPEQYILQLLADLNGGARSDPNAGIINKGIGRFKRAAVFSSLSVTVQQPSAIARAAALIDTKYFVNKPSTKAWDEVKKYAPIAIIKEMGYFDTNTGVSTVEFIKAKEYTGAKAKMAALVTDSQYRDEILSKGAALADEMAWCNIWEAVKKETADKGLKGEELLQAAGKRFTEVIVSTQVYDSVLSRSGLMRSKDTGMKMATAFMAEPTTSLNMITDALIQGKRGNKAYARKAIGSVIASMILNSILVSFVYAGRDDDEDKSYVEKYIGTLTEELMDSFNPLTLIPFAKDIVSIVQGYDVERSDMAVVTDLYKAWRNLSSSNRSVYRKVEDFAGAIAAGFSLPVKNIMRDMRGMYNTVMSFVRGPETTGRGIGEAVRDVTPKWLGGGERSNGDELYHAMLHDDAKHAARVKARFKNEIDVAYAIRDGLVKNDPRITAAAEARVAGNQSEYMRIAREITGEKHFSQDDVVRAINYVTEKMRKVESTPSLSDPDTFKVLDYFNEAMSNDQAEAELVKREMISKLMKEGKTAEEAETSFNSSFKNNAVKPAFAEGKLSVKRAVSLLQKYGGMDEDMATADVQYWAFKQNYPDIPVDDSWFDKYYEYAADVGIPIDTFMKYKNEVKGIDGEGKKARRMAVIDSLPLTYEQKDALYYSEGWVASTIHDAPWH